MAKARCPGTGCDYEGAEKAVLTHMRKCSRFAHAYRSGGDSEALDPVKAYAAAHPPKPPAEPRAPRKAEPSVASAAPPVAADADPGVSDSTVSGADGELPASLPVAPVAKSGGRRGARKKHQTPELVSQDPKGVVSVEYWDWEPTLLEDLRADASQSDVSAHSSS